MKNEKKRIPEVFITGVLLLLDQAVKNLFSDSERYFCNAGGPLGIDVDNGVLIVVTATILVAVAYFFLRNGSSPVGFALEFVLAGGFSNLLDRVAFGCVRDFSLVSWFPAFNFADVSLTIGAAMILFVSIFSGSSRGRVR